MKSEKSAVALDGMSLDELAALRERLEAEVRAKTLDAARAHAATAAAELEWLNRAGVLAPKVARALGSGGKAIDPSALLAADAPKKTRAPRKRRAPNLRRDPDTGELYRPQAAG